MPVSVMGARRELTAGLALLAVSVPLLLGSGGQAAAGSMLSYRIDGGERQALLCRPRGTGPFPAVVYNHGLIVDRVGYERAARRGYDLDGICGALAADGFLAFAPIRRSGPGNIPRHKEEVGRAGNYVKGLPDVD